MNYKTYCPGCNSLNDGSTEVNGSRAHPTDGDISLCAYCGTLSKYVAKGETIKLVALTPKENADIMKHPDIKKAMAFYRDSATIRDL